MTITMVGEEEWVVGVGLLMGEEDLGFFLVPGLTLEDVVAVVGGTRVISVMSVLFPSLNFPKVKKPCLGNLPSFRR